MGQPEVESPAAAIQVGPRKRPHEGTAQRKGLICHEDKRLRSQMISTWRKVVLTSEEEGDDCIPQEEPEHQKEPEGQQQPVKVLVELEETLTALKELPGLVAAIKTALEKLPSACTSSTLSQSDCQQTPGSDTSGDDLVSKRLFTRIGSRRLSLFTQELATMIFGKETLAKSTLTGKGKKGEAKDQLDPEKAEAIIDTVREKFPNTMVSEIRALLRRKCNNEGYTKVAPQ
ncbi:unnamed protein product [Boreogadus saida]